MLARASNPFAAPTRKHSCRSKAKSKLFKCEGKWSYGPEFRVSSSPAVRCRGEDQKRAAFGVGSRGDTSPLQQPDIHDPLGLRAHNRILKIARTIAELEDSAQLEPKHIVPLARPHLLGIKTFCRILRQTGV
jgi:hypothetical protein